MVNEPVPLWTLGLLSHEGCFLSHLPLPAHTDLNMEQRYLEAVSWTLKARELPDSLQDLHRMHFKKNVTGKSLSSLTSDNRNDLSAPCSPILVYLEHF